MLYVADSDGCYQQASQEIIIQCARQLLNRPLRRGMALSDPRQVYDYLSLRYGAFEYEFFGVFLLDVRYRLIEFIELFRGTIDGVTVHPREVMKLVLEKNAAAVIFCHPHPSGVAEASLADEHITRRLISALSLIDVKVLDHLIIAGGQVSSLSEQGLM
jgi:DNA repair protein RadC